MYLQCLRSWNWDRPEIAEQALALFGSGSSFAEISGMTGLNFRTIARLAAENQETVEAWRLEATRKAKEVAGMLLERIYDKAADPEAESSLKHLTIAYGIVTDKSRVLQGEPAAITEQRSGLDVSKAKAAIEQAQKRIRAEAISV
ncbi:MAG: hypothetical protein R6V45_13420 [Oceanipulchritudo sp.]